MYDVEPPPEAVPRTVQEALLAIAKLQVWTQNQETKLGELSAENHDQSKEIETLKAEINALKLINAADNAVRRASKYLITVVLAVAGLWLSYRTITGPK